MSSPDTSPATTGKVEAPRPLSPAEAASELLTRIVGTASGATPESQVGSYVDQSVVDSAMAKLNRRMPWMLADIAQSPDSNYTKLLIQDAVIRVIAETYAEFEGDDKADKRHKYSGNVVRFSEHTPGLNQQPVRVPKVTSIGDILPWLKQVGEDAGILVKDVLNDVDVMKLSHIVLDADSQVGNRDIVLTCKRTIYRGKLFWYLAQVDIMEATEAKTHIEAFDKSLRFWGKKLHKNFHSDGVTLDGRNARHREDFAIDRSADNWALILALATAEALTDLGGVTVLAREAIDGIKWGVNRRRNRSRDYVKEVDGSPFDEDGKAIAQAKRRVIIGRVAELVLATGALGYNLTHYNISEFIDLVHSVYARTATEAQLIRFGEGHILALVGPFILALAEIINNRRAEKAIGKYQKSINDWIFSPLNQLA